MKVFTALASVLLAGCADERPTFSDKCGYPPPIAGQLVAAENGSPLVVTYSYYTGEIRVLVQGRPVYVDCAEVKPVHP